MSYKASAWAVEVRVGDPTSKLLLLTLAEAASLDEHVAWPSISTLARRIEASENTVRRKLRHLADLGLIEVSGGSGGRASNRYTLRVGADPGKGETPARLEGVSDWKGCHSSGTPPLPPMLHPTPAIAMAPEPSKKGNGTVKDSATPSGEAASPRGGKPIPAHRELIEAWANAYREVFRANYVFGGGKDGSAVKRLIATGMTPGEVVQLARAAWRIRDRRGMFYAKMAVTISGLACRINEIRDEVGRSGTSLAPAAVQGGFNEL